MMTEEEAKTKWCPFARCAGEINGHVISGSNRLGEPWQCSPFADQILCIASGCMAWRAAVEMENRQDDSGPPAGDGWRKVGPVIGEGGFMTKRQVWQRAVGRCGLAGQSE